METEERTVWSYIWSEAAIVALITGLLYYSAYLFEVAFLLTDGISFQLAIVTKESLLMSVAPLGLLTLVIYFTTILDKVDNAKLARVGVSIFVTSTYLLILLAIYFTRGVWLALAFLALFVFLEVRAYRRLGREGAAAKLNNIMSHLGSRVHPSARVTWMALLSVALAFPFACFLFGVFVSATQPLPLLASTKDGSEWGLVRAYSDRLLIRKVDPVSHDYMREYKVVPLEQASDFRFGLQR
jgi:hypothetical protein